MNDMPPGERLAKLRALEEWLAWQLETTRRKIHDLEQQERQAVGYVVEKKIHEGHPLAATIHLADCTMPARETRPIDAETARRGLTEDPAFFQACEFCDPRKSLGVADG
jgi:nitrile hydratase